MDSSNQLYELELLLKQSNIMTDEDFNNQQYTYKGSIIYKGDIKLYKNANEWVVSYSKTINALFGCNNAIYILGNEESAKVAVFYVCKYIAKDGVKIASALSALKIAMTLHQRFAKNIVEVDIKENNNSKKKIQMNYVINKLLNIMKLIKDYLNNIIVIKIL